MKATQTYCFRFERCQDRSQLEKDWLSVQNTADGSFFLSWMWVGTWLESLAPKAWVLRAFDEDQTLCGIGLFVFNKRKRLGVVSSNVLHLHETGVADQDQIWIEYNGLLTREGLAENFYAELFAFLKGIESWDEFIVGAISAEVAATFSRSLELYCHQLWHSKSYGVALTPFTENADNYLSSLSSGLRRQINRCRRFYSEFGEVSMIRPNTLAGALDSFDQIAPLHELRWREEPTGSGFTNPLFVGFHKTLIEKAWPQGGVDLLTLRAGDRPIGYLYNFIFRGKVYFYLGAFVQEQDSKAKPGFLAHTMAIQEYIDQGLSYYDFMGGEADYKVRLANRHSQLYQMSWQRNTIGLIAERQLRKIKRRVGL